jgi:endoglycosylceramidase
VNTTYLQQVEQIINALGEAGIYSIVDMHQGTLSLFTQSERNCLLTLSGADLMSRFYCGEGMPDWLVSHDSRFRFPTPIDNPNMTFDSNGYPTLDDCLKVFFCFAQSRSHHMCADLLRDLLPLRLSVGALPRAVHKLS